MINRYDRSIDRLHRAFRHPSRGVSRFFRELAPFLFFFLFAKLLPRERLHRIHEHSNANDHGKSIRTSDVQHHDGSSYNYSQSRTSSDRFVNFFTNVLSTRLNLDRPIRYANAQKFNGRRMFRQEIRDYEALLFRQATKGTLLCGEV